MGNSSIIENAKTKIVKEFINSVDIIQAIDSQKLGYQKPQELVGTHIFDYNQDPWTLDNVDTFLTIQVHIPEGYFRSKPFHKPQIEIWIISHQRHMKVNNIPKIRINRNDYLSILIDRLLNGRNDFGIGRLELTINIEGAFQKDYVYRKMIFETTDFNQSVCNDE